MPDLFGRTRICALAGCEVEITDWPGRARFCCQAHQVKAWKAENVDRWREYSQAWRAAHPDYAKRWRAAKAAGGSGKGGGDCSHKKISPYEPGI